MQKKLMDRRNFLKWIGCFLSGLCLANLGRFWQKLPSTGTELKEAKYYKAGRDLAG